MCCGVLGIGKLLFEIGRGDELTGGNGENRE
jgi:hypothetical protein